MNNSVSPGMKCLVVDDDLVSRQMLVSISKYLGMEPETAINGQEAIRMARDNEYDIIFMDCVMPFVDGLTATIEIRQFAAQLPIVGITSECNEEECTQAGMDYFISKPVSQADIRLACEFLQLT